jgi:hypothetical protein
MTAAGVTTLEGYGHYLGQRYATASNILWVHAGDYNPPTPDLVDAIARGIRAETTLQLHTAHTSRNDTASNIWGQFPWLDVDNVYTDSETYAPSLALYQSTTTPFFLIEAYYEGEHNMSEEALRYQAYGALLGGAMGHMFGNNPMWCLGASTCFPTTATPPTWQGQLDGRGSLDMAALASAWAPLAWDKLVPSATLVSQDGTDARAALASDGALALVYTQSLGSFDLDLSGFAGPVDAVRIDPTDATETALPGSPFPNSGTRTVTLSDSNATGTDDWLLRFRVTP